MGLVYADLGEAQKALDYSAQALPKQQTHHEEGMTLNNMASLYEELGELAKALELFSKAQQAHVAGGSQSGQAMALGNMAQVNQKLGNLDLAEKQFLPERFLQMTQLCSPKVGQTR